MKMIFEKSLLFDIMIIILLSYSTLLLFFL